jgi:hypothetical protein
MKGHLIVTASLAMAMQSTLGAAEDIHCEAFGKVESSRARSSTLNPDGSLTIVTKSNELGSLCDGAHFGWNWQVRAAAREQWDTSNSDSSDYEIVLRQAYRTFDLGDQWTLTAGRKLRGWDTGYSAQPIDFLGEKKNSADLEDRLSERTPSVFLAFDHIGDDWTNSVIFAENRLYEKKRPQILLTAETNRHGTNLQLILQKTSDQPWGGGGGASTVIGKALELHGSFFGRRGTARPIHLSLINDDFRFYGPGENPVSEHRLHDGTWYPQWVVGGQWTAESGLNLLMEWTHDSSGLTPEKWRQLLALSGFHAGGAAFGVPPAGIRGNVAFDAATLSRVGGTMQDYAFARAVYPFTQFDAEAYALINAYDRSSAAGVRFTYKVSRRFQSWLDLRWNRGHDGTEFGEVPVARSMLLGFRYFFQ